MHVLIVHAHPEPTSFCSAMTAEAAASLSQAGHGVVISDLYAMGFDPVSDRRNFLTRMNPERFNQQAEETHASAHDGFAPDIQVEMDKLAACDALILQFPFWWFGLPAMLKGWVDRVLAVGRAYGGRRWFDRGVFAGKRAMCALTVGGGQAIYSPDGVNGPMSSILFPIQHGILNFVGFTVVEPFIVYAPGRMSHAERVACLVSYRARVLGLETAPTIGGVKTTDYDDNLVLKSRRSP
jgi:NAD(P)H dehydrogenase (quinone)